MFMASSVLELATRSVSLRGRDFGLGEMAALSGADPQAKPASFAIGQSWLHRFAPLP